MIKKANENKNIILRKDYERYTMSLPLRVILKNKKRSYVFSELEKMHPCFSEACIYDLRTRFGKKGFISDVLVMDKIKLAEYKSVFENKQLYIEENLKKDVFGTGNKDFLFWIIVVLLMLFLSAGLFLKSKLSMVQKNGFDDLRTSESEKSDLLISEESFMKPGELLNNFLSVVEKENGKIKELEVNCDGFTEGFCATVNYLYPENLKQLECNMQLFPVTYSNKIPSMKVSFKERVSCKNIKEKASDVYLFNAKFREIILKYGGELIEENVSKHSVSFNIKNPGIFKLEEFINQFWEVFIENNICMGALFMKSGDSFSFDVHYSPQSGVASGIQLDKLKRKMNLFFETPDSSKNDSYKTEVKKTAGKKIGEIKHSDGTSNSFIRQENGKLLFVTSSRNGGAQ